MVVLQVKVGKDEYKGMNVMGVIPPQSIRKCPVCNCLRQFKYNPNTKHSHCNNCGVISMLATKPKQYRQPKCLSKWNK